MSGSDEFAEFDTDETTFDAMMRHAENSQIVTPPKPPDGLFPRPQPRRRTLSKPLAPSNYRTVITLAPLEQYL
jgi:hypothetical protein